MRLFAIAALVLLPALASAQSFRVPGAPQPWYISVAAVYQDGLSVGGEGGSASPTPDTSITRVSSELGYGFNVGYNFNKNLALGLDIEYLRPDYKATLVSEDPNVSPTVIDHTLTQWNWRLKGTYNFSEGPLVPYVDLGYGWSNVDSNVADGPPLVGCWWDPWWGYVCDNFYRTISSTESGWGGGVGVRYDLPMEGFLRLSWNRWELASGGNSDDLDLESFRLEYAWTF
ncbi:MAG: outer membrane beta-barrel protein [Woeseiaceae bacterium]|nr:outer membrane beta-barrel protein [Woeseiaceae bacterium]